MTSAKSLLVWGPIWLGCCFPVEPQSRIVKLVVRKELEHLSWCFAVLETGKLLRRQMSMPHLSVAFLFGICMVSFGWHRILTVSCRIYTSPAKNGWDIAFSVNWFDSANAWFRTGQSQKCSRLTLVRSCHVYSLRFAVYGNIYHYISSYIFNN